MTWMKKYRQAFLWVQVLFIYAWLTVLSPLSVTDTYYSVYLICGIAGLLCLADNYRFVSGGNVDQPNVVVLTTFAVIFSCAVALANYVLFEPLSVLQNLFDLICCLFGGASIGYQVLTCLMRRLPLKAKESQRNHPIHVFFLVFGSIAVIDLLYLLFVLYPGVLTLDSLSTIAQIMGDKPYNNTMPYWHTVTVGVFVKLGFALFGNMNAAVGLFHGVQILFMAACFGCVLVTLYQMGMPKLVMVAVYAIHAFMPYNIVYSITLWKDIPFAGSAVLMVTGLYRLLRNIGKSKVLNYVIFVVGTIGFSLLRTNGWYAFLVTVLVMFFLLRKSHKKLLVLMAIVLVVCWILINPLLDILGVSSTNMVEAFAVPMQQIARVVSNGRELTQDETTMLSEIFSMDELAEAYDPVTVDPVKFDTFRYDKVDYIMDHLGEYLKIYLDLGARYPDDYLKAWVDETKGYWNGGYFFSAYTLKTEKNVYDIATTGGDNMLAKLYAAAFRYIEKPAILQFTISIGLYVWGLVSCCVINALKRRKECLLTIPLLVLVAGLWLGTPVYAEFRYAYPFILAMPLILCATFYRTEDELGGAEGKEVQ